jgi:hypothetical protein
LTAKLVQLNIRFYLYTGSKQEGTGQWMSLDAEQIMENGVVVGTRNPTGDYLLIDCRFELPYGKAFHV